MRKITDTHAHLYYPEIVSDIENILGRAKDKGIEKIIVPAVNYNTSLEILNLSEKHDMIFCALGIHPCDVSTSGIKDIDGIEKLLDHEKVVGIGETGLDYYWDKTQIEKQKEYFKLQIDIAKDKNLPVIIHTRDSLDDAISIIKEKYDGKLKGQFHCFSGNTSQLNEIIKMNNFYVSFCGNVTYKSFLNQDSVSECPEDRMLSETDSPFLPPVPYRGRKNEPSYILNTLKKISEIKSIDYEKLLDNLYKNSEELFFSKSI